MGRFVRVNRRLEVLLGYTARELRDCTLESLLVPADREHSRALSMDLLAARREAIQSEARYRRKDGEPVWMLTTMAVIPGPDGAPRHVITIVEDITAQRRAQEELEASRAELRALSQKLLGVQEAERTRLARELHDQIGQALSAVMISLESLVRPTPSERRRASPVLDSMAVVERAIEQVRTLSFDLRPAMLDDLGLAAAAAAYCKRQSKLAGIEVDLDIGPLTGAPPKEVEVACFRILQEAVTNVLRHAEAKRLTVRLGGDERELDLAVEDDGRGFDPERQREAGPGGHLGILGMRERAELVGGTVHVDSAPGRGTFVQAHFTFEERDAHDR
jgi:two-component system sensor histidine kinase UhpB